MSAAADQVTTKQTTITALKSAAPDNQLPNVIVGFTSLQAFELTQRVAKMFAASSIVPDSFRGNLPNCCIALEMAGRLGASPLMVMQNIDVIYGRPAWRSKFLIASFNQCGRFEEITYKWTGKKGTDSWGCIANSVSKRTGKVIEGPEVTIALAKEEGWYDRKGSKWKTIPQLMLMYRAGAWLVNTHAPEISMGLQTEDEIRDTYDAQRSSDGSYAVDLECLRRTEAMIDEQYRAINQTTPAANDEGQKADAPEPKYTKESAIHVLKEAGSSVDLEKAWVDIGLDHKQTNREIDPDIEDLYKSRKEDLAKL